MYICILIIILKLKPVPSKIISMYLYALAVLDVGGLRGIPWQHVIRGLERSSGNYLSHPC